MLVETANLRRINTYAKAQTPPVSRQYIYLLIAMGKMEAVTIDDAQFIDIVVYPKVTERLSREELAKAKEKLKKKK